MEHTILECGSKCNECRCLDNEDAVDYEFDEVDYNYDEVSTSLHEAYDEFKDFSKELYDINCLIESCQPIDDEKIMKMIERAEQLDLYSEEIVQYTKNWRESIDIFFKNFRNKEN